MVSTQFLSHCYDGQTHNVKAEQVFTLESVEKTELALALSALMAAHQSYLISIQSVYTLLCKYKPEAENVTIDRIQK